MTFEFNFTIVYRIVELVCLVGALVIICVVSYLMTLPADITRGLTRFLMALVCGYIFVMTADVASRFLGAGIAAIAMFAFTVVGFALFTSTAASLGYAYFKTSGMIPVSAILALNGLLLAVDAVLTYARVQRATVVTSPKMSLK